MNLRRLSLLVISILLTTSLRRTGYAGQGSWTSGGPKGCVNAVAADPLTPSTLYAGTGAGLFKSTDSGDTWSPSGLVTEELSSIVINPTTPSTLYAATKSGKVFRSSDGGDTWAAAQTGLPAKWVSSLAVDPSAPSTLYAGVRTGSYQFSCSYCGLYKSSNSGDTWSKTTLFDAANHRYLGVHSLVLDPANSATIYAGTNWGLHVSTDAGATWADPQPYSWVTFDTLAIGPGPTGMPSTLYSPIGRSTDAGRTWIDAGKLPLQGSVVVAADPARSGILYAGVTPAYTFQSAAVYKSTDYGNTWAQSKSGFPDIYAQVNELSVGPESSVYVGLDCIGVWQLSLGSPPNPNACILPSSAFRNGANGAEFHTDVRMLNLGTAAVTVVPTFYDQSSGTTTQSPPLTIPGRSQLAFDNVLQSLFGHSVETGSYGPIRFDPTGPIVVSASVNNVNACGNGATSGQWLPGILAAKAIATGVIPELAVSANSSTGYRTNLVIMNPGTATAAVTIKARAGDGTLLSTAPIGPLPVNGFRQVALDDLQAFPGMAGRTDTNLWAELTSSQPVLAFASVINNGSGDPFAVVATADAKDSSPGSWLLPSSAFRAGANGAEFHTDIRLLNIGSAAATVRATLYDQSSGATFRAQDFSLAPRNQAAFDNALASLFGRSLPNGSFGPIRFESSQPLIVSSSVNNVNACGTGATSGQWLPGIAAIEAISAGAVPQLAVSAKPSEGYRTNLVVMNPGAVSTTTNVNIRSGSGMLLSTGTIGPLTANGFSQVALDNPQAFSGVAGRTDANLWAEFVSTHPVIVFASVINNASGDPFAVVGTSDTGLGFPLNLTGTFSGTANGGPMTLTLEQKGTVLSGSGTTFYAYNYPVAHVLISGTVNGTSVSLYLSDNDGGCLKSFSHTVKYVDHTTISGTFTKMGGCDNSSATGSFSVTRQ